MIEESKNQPVLVDFWAPWCGPCKQLTPVLEKAVKAAKGKVKLAKMNIDEHPAIPGQMGIQSIPAVIAFSNGQPVDGFMGALPESQVIAFLERLTKDKIGGEEQDLLKAADAALVEGNAAAAAEIYAQLLAGRIPAMCTRWPGSRAAMSRPALSSRPSRRSPWCRKPSSNEAPVAAARAALEVAEQAQVGRAARRAGSTRSPPIRSTIRRASISPPRSTPHGKRAEAVEQLLAIVRKDRTWNDDGARKQLVQFFEAWGFADPAAVEGRKQLSSILFS